MALKYSLKTIRFNLIATIVASAAMFTSCSPVKMQVEDPAKLIQQSVNGGDVYGGKQFVLPTDVACTDGKKIKSIMVLNAAGAYSLVRNNCQLLNDPLAVPSSDITASGPVSIEYRGERFTEQFEGLPKFYLPAITTKWCRGKVSTLNELGTTAFIEFAQIGIGDYQGQVSWLDFSTGKYIYYSSPEIGLINRDPALNGDWIFTGTDASLSPALNVGITVTPGLNLGVANLTIGGASIAINITCTGF